MVCVLIKMGGSGTRFGADIPKQFCEINGKPLFCHLLEEYKNIDQVDKVIIICKEEWIDFTREYAEKILGEKLINVINGGTTGAKSIYNGVMYASHYLSDDDVLLTHDVTNPIVSKEKISEVIDETVKYDFAVLATEQVHTIYEKNDNNFIEKTLNRKNVCSGYSPEGFKFKKIYDCYCNATNDELETMTSAIALANKYNAKAKLVISNILNLKITYKDDLEILKKLYSNND